MIWFSLLAPIVTIVIMFFLFKKEIVWWEYLVPILVTSLFIVIVKSIGEFSLTKDTEYWGGAITKGVYFEPWDEKVSCRHPKYRTETYTYSCGTTKAPRTCTGTRTVFDGWMHLYDVDYHGPVWEIKESNGFSFRVSQNTWSWIVNKFGNKTFVELNRSYHSIDGDSYVTTWNGDYESLIPVTTEHSYENRVQSSSSVFNYKPVEGKEKIGLYEYVYDGILDTPSVLPTGIPGSAHIEKLNAILGAKNEVRIWVLIFKDKDREIAYRQEALWKNGNMNELVVCIGVDSDYKIKWAEVFSWTKKEEIKTNIKTYLESKSKLDLTEFAPYLREQIEKHWKRRDFKEFSYLQVEQPTWAIVVAWILSIATSVACSIFLSTNSCKQE